MKKISAITILLIAITAVAVGQQIKGDYVETRSADVYTGQCFANGEVNLVGNEAILGWRVEQGEWNGVSLNGLAVVVVVRAKATLGDPYPILTLRNQFSSWTIRQMPANGKLWSLSPTT